MKTTIRVLRFWTEYKVNADGSPRPIDMVEYGPAGGLQLRTNTATVTSLSKLRPVDANSEDEAAKIAHARWSAIEPMYRAWKDGQEIPAQGTPFAAWTGITQQQADILKMAGLRSVEDLAEASDSVMNTIRLPGIRGLQTTAKAFLASFDKQATAMRLEKAEQEAAASREQLEEMRQIMLDMQKQLDERNEKKRGRAKVEVQEEEAA